MSEQHERSSMNIVLCTNANLAEAGSHAVLLPGCSTARQPSQPRVSLTAVYKCTEQPRRFKNVFSAKLLFRISFAHFALLESAARCIDVEFAQPANRKVHGSRQEEF